MLEAFLACPVKCHLLSEGEVLMRVRDHPLRAMPRGQRTRGHPVEIGTIVYGCPWVTCFAHRGNSKPRVDR